jgi:hypothetical protein
MTDKNTELQNLLIQKLLAGETPTTGPSSISTISIIILVTIILIIGGVVIYYIFIRNITPSYPLSPFKFGDKIVIRPAINTDYKDLEKQYLSSLLPVTPPEAAYRYPYDPAPVGNFMGEGAYATRFIGDINDKSSRWVLEQKSAAGGYDANQSLLYGLGNRFYLRTDSNDDVNDLKGRLRSQIANQQAKGQCPNVTPVVIGSNTTSQNWFTSELICYFLPTNYPDLYYILIANCASRDYLNVPNTSVSPNNGILTIRPWSELLNDNISKDHFTYNYNCATTTGCAPGTAGHFNPYNSNNQLYDNVLITNFLTEDKLLPPYENANVSLFKVTLAT